MNIELFLKNIVRNALEQLYSKTLENEQITVNKTNEQFTGDLTIIAFALTRVSGKKPDETATELGEFLKNKHTEVEKYEVVKGFLNITFTQNFWLQTLNNVLQAGKNYGKSPKKNEVVVIEYSGPNTNKALHLGHLRNISLGHATAEILTANGYTVHKVCIYNDRGTAICKSMLAWMLYGNGETPESTNTKGDHLISKYYTLFAQKLEVQTQSVMQKMPEIEKREAEKLTPLMQQTQELLLKWEANDPETLQLWRQMNNWAYKGFNETYSRLGVDFEKNYYESETYLLGKEIIEKGLKDGVFYKENDDSIQIDLTAEKLDKKVVLRADGTSLYVTQDLGVAELRYSDYKMDKSIYVVANEQDYHFKVLFTILKKLGKLYAKGMYHLSYGMVNLPDGKMKSREGTVVEADDLIDEMIEIAEAETQKAGKADNFTPTEAKELYRILGLGALKFFILKVSPKKSIVFDPKESIDLQGFTATFVQYTFARIQSIKRKYNKPLPNFSPILNNTTLRIDDTERELIVKIYHFANAINEAATNYDPSAIANYVYELAKLYNHFYSQLPILNAEDETLKSFRILLSDAVGNTLETGLKLLGIEVPTRM